MLKYSFRSGNFEIAVYDSLTEELIDQWDQLKSESLNSGYLKLIEESKPLDLHFRYALIKKSEDKNKELCAILYFQQLKFTSKNIRFHNSFFLSQLSNIILKIRPFNFLICGNAFAVNFPSINFIESKINQHEIIGIITEIDAREKSDVLILKDMDDVFTPTGMLQYNLEHYSFDLTMSLKIRSEWNSLDDYIQSLTKKYKRRTEKIIEAGNSMVHKELNAEEIQFESGQIKKLFTQVTEKQTIRMGLMDVNYFYEFKKRFPGKFTFVAYYFNNSMVAFSTYIYHESTLETHYVGIDYNYNKEFMIYFNLLLDGVEKGIKMKMEHLELGRTAREAKANIGGKPLYFNDYINVKGWLAKTLTKKFTGYFHKELGENWKERHPFKK